MEHRIVKSNWVPSKKGFYFMTDEKIYDKHTRLSRHNSGVDVERMETIGSLETGVSALIY